MFTYSFMLIQPKPYMDKFKLRHHAEGVERRRNMSKIVLEKGTPLPKPIEYSDIDQAMYEWVDKKIELVYNGKRLPTYKLYSTQRISEYIETWKEIDETGNPTVNFKTITRDNNPQKGEIYGGYFNIPGHKNFALYYVPVLQENGTEAYDKYTIKQPFGVNFTYSIQIVTNKMEIVNKMNETMLYEFNAITCYLTPNGHPMSMTLEDISDESEYTIDDRKYYSQTYKIKVKGYIIRREDFSVERVQSRFVMSSHDSDAAGLVNRRKKNRRDYEKVKFLELSDEESRKFQLQALETDPSCTVNPVEKQDRPSEIVDKNDDTTSCCDQYNRFYNKVIKIIMNFDLCGSELTFTIDKEMIIDNIETKNVYDFRLIVNGELMNLDNEIKFVDGDEITVRITRDDPHSDSEFTLVGYDPNSVVDTEKDEETVLDEQVAEEDILINPKEENE